MIMYIDKQMLKRKYLYIHVLMNIHKLIALIKVRRNHEFFGFEGLPLSFCFHANAYDGSD